MPDPDAKRDLDALIKAREENRAKLGKTRMEQLQAAIDAMRNSRRTWERAGKTQTKWNI